MMPKRTDHDHREIELGPAGREPQVCYVLRYIIFILFLIVSFPKRHRRAFKLEKINSSRLSPEVVGF